MKRTIFGVWMVLVLLLTACSLVHHKEDTTAVPEGTVMMYYIDADNMEFQEVPYRVMTDTDNKEAVDEVMKQLYRETDWNSKYQLPTMDYFRCTDYSVKKGQVRIDMTVVAKDGTAGIILLCKAATVKTLCQLDYVDSVVFNCKSSADPYTDEYTQEVYTAEDFVSSSSDGGYVQNGQIDIYFANEDGTELKKYSKLVEISNNVSLEQIVIESLLTGPLREGFVATMPEGTQLNKISVKDGVAYVDFNDAFNGQAGDLRSELTLYSVVNSLCSLPTISRVQILINGEKQDVYRETIDISNTLERNLDIIEKED